MPLLFFKMGLQLTAEQVEERQAAREAQRRLLRLQEVTRQASARSVARTRRYRTRRDSERRAAADATRRRDEAAAQALTAAARVAALANVRVMWHCCWVDIRGCRKNQRTSGNL